MCLNAPLTSHLVICVLLLLPWLKCTVFKAPDSRSELRVPSRRNQPGEYPPGHIMAAQLPSPPFLDIPGLPNFRDLGGYPIALQPGKAVRRGVVFRSGEPSQTTDEGIAKLRELGIAHVYDLRSNKELERDKKNGKDRGIKEWEGAKRIYAPVFRDEDYSPEVTAQRLEGYKDGAEVRGS